MAKMTPMPLVELAVLGSTKMPSTMETTTAAR